MSGSRGPTSAVGGDVIEIERGGAGGGAAFGRGRVHELAARFAAKEAVMKALGTGARGVAWREIEVLPNHRGKPLVYLYGRAKARAERIGLGGLDVSMSHSREYAVAFVVGRSRDLEPDRPGWRRKLIGILRGRGPLGGGGRGQG